MVPEAGSMVQIGSVVNMKGQVFADHGDGVRPLSPGAPVHQGEVILTKAGSNVEIKFLDDTVLSEGENSNLRLDSYAFDPSKGGSLLFNMAEGAFRVVTGKIADNNPENFKLKSPLATIGIRGTTVVSEIRNGVEKHGAEEIHSGKALTIQNALGQVQLVTSSRGMVDFRPDGSMGAPRPFSVQEIQHFQTVTPIQSVPTFTAPPPPPPSSSGGQQGGSPQQGQSGGQPQGAPQQAPQQGSQGGGQEGSAGATAAGGSGAVVVSGSGEAGATVTGGAGVGGGLIGGAFGGGTGGVGGTGGGGVLVIGGSGIGGSGIGGSGIGGSGIGGLGTGGLGGLLYVGGGVVIGGGTSLVGTGTGGTGTGLLVGPGTGTGGGTGNGNGGSAVVNDEADKKNEGNAGSGGGTGQGGDTQAASHGDSFLAVSSGETLTGTAYADTLTGLGARNWLQGLGGGDTLIGGSWDHRSMQGDIADYSWKSGGVYVNLALGTAVAGDSRDTLTNLMGVRGGSGGDTLIGNGHSYLEGGGGDDTLYGANVIDGSGTGSVASYMHASGGVTVVLDAGSTIITDTNGDTAAVSYGTSAGADGHDLLFGIHKVIGSAYADTLIGSNFSDNWFQGHGGEDSIVGGNSSFGFGTRLIDTISFEDQAHGVFVDLGNQTMSGGDAQIHFRYIEGVDGTTLGDTLIGDGGNNWFMGNGGSDTITGGGHTPSLGGSYDGVGYTHMASGVTVDLNAGKAVYAGGQDTLTGINAAEGSQFNDTLIGSNTQGHWFQGNLGDDFIAAGSLGKSALYLDTASYEDATGGVTVDLSLSLDETLTYTTNGVTMAYAVGDHYGTAAGADGHDTLLSIEGVSGSSHADLIKGGAETAMILANCGDDTVAMGTHFRDQVVIDGGNGTDTLSFTSNGTTTYGLQNVVYVEKVVLGNANTSIQTNMTPGLFGLMTFDASALDGHTLAFDGSGEATMAFSILGGAGADALTLGLAGNAVNAGAGNDSITYLGSPPDNVGEQVWSGDLINGGADDDTLTYTDTNISSSSGELNGLSHVEHIVIKGADAFVTPVNDLAPDDGSVAIDGSQLTGALTFDGSHQTADLHFTPGSHGGEIIGGAGDDSFLAQADSEHWSFAGGSGHDALDASHMNSGVVVNVSGASADGLSGRLIGNGDGPSGVASDVSFATGGGGSFSSFDHSGYSSVALDNAGNILAGGSESSSGSTGMFVDRYSSDGVPDESFGQHGYAAVDLSGNAVSGLLNAVASDGYGRVLAAGSASYQGDQDMVVSRLTSGGATDTTFGYGGTAHVDFNGGADSASAMVQDSGRGIILAGQTAVSGHSSAALARLDANGQLDQTFGADGTGKTVLSVAGYADVVFNAVTLDGEGRILAAGQAVGQDGDMLLVRYTSGGLLDPTFGTGGVVHLDLGGAENLLTLAVDGDAIVVGGTAGDSSSVNLDFLVARFTSSGELDTSFGQGGLVRTDLSGEHSNDVLNSLAIDPATGQIIAVGSSGDESLVDAVVLRYNSDGSLDPTNRAGVEYTYTNNVWTTQVGNSGVWGTTVGFEFHGDGNLHGQGALLGLVLADGAVIGVGQLTAGSYVGASSEGLLLHLGPTPSNEVSYTGVDELVGNDDCQSWYSFGTHLSSAVTLTGGAQGDMLFMNGQNSAVDALDHVNNLGILELQGAGARLNAHDSLGLETAASPGQHFLTVDASALTGTLVWDAHETESLHEDITLGSGLEHATILGGAGDDTITGSGFLPHSGDTLDGGGGTNTLGLDLSSLLQGDSVSLSLDFSGATLTHFDTISITGPGDISEYVTLALTTGENLVAPGSEAHLEFDIGGRLASFSLDARGETDGTLDMFLPDADYAEIWTGSGGGTIDASMGFESIVIHTGAGDDTVTNFFEGNGGEGGFAIFGSAGNDDYSLGMRNYNDNSLDYSGSGLDSVTVSLGQGPAESVAGQVAKSGGGTDAIQGFLHYTGTAGDDVFKTADMPNGLGYWELTFHGGRGTDTLDYSNYASGCALTLGSGMADSGIHIDYFDGIEVIRGSEAADQFVVATGVTLSNHVPADAFSGTILGGGGDDAITVGQGFSGVVDGGLGDDTILVKNTQVTVLLGLGQDTITNSSESPWGDMPVADFSQAEASVTLDLSQASHYAMSGGETLATLNGHWNVSGSEFADTIIGGAAPMTIEGRGGNDVLDGGASGIATVSYEHAANDVFVDLEVGTLGSSITLPGHNAWDMIGTATNGAGSDTLLRFANIIGSAHDDTLVGDWHDNTIDGGLGGHDVLDGDGGTDVVSFAHAAQGVYVNLNAGFLDSDDYATLGHFTDDPYGTAEGGDVHDKLFGFQAVFGSAHDDTIVLGAGDFSAYGGLGSDTIQITGADAQANHVLMGYLPIEGRDTLGHDLLDYSQAGYGVDMHMVEGETYSAYHLGAAGQTLFHMDGTDTLFHSDSVSDFDNVRGASGFGNAIVSTDDETSNTIEGGSLADSLDGGGGNNVLSYAHAAAGVTVDLRYVGMDNTSHQTAVAQNTGGAGVDTLSHFSGVIGSSHGDDLRAYDFDATLWGGGGDVGDTLHAGVSEATATLYGEGGNDTLYGGSDGGFGYLDGGSGDDTLTAGSSGDTLYGGSGNDTLYGGPGSTLYGGDGSDAISLGTASDTICTVDGGAGSDTLSYTDTDDFSSSGELDGVSHVERIVITGPAAHVAPVNDLAPDDGSVTIDGSQLTGSLNLDAHYQTAKLVVIGGVGDDVVALGSGDATLDGGGGNNTLSCQFGSGVTVNLAGDAYGSAWGGGMGADTLFRVQNVVGSEGNDLITGNAQNNTLFGGDGNDTLRGGEGGADSIDGGDGFNVVDMGSYYDSSDRLYGGTGTNNTLIFHHTASGPASYDLSNVAHFSSLIVTADHGKTVTLTPVTGASVDLDQCRVDASGLYADDHLVFSGTVLATPMEIHGGHGDDTITGGQGNDTLWGGDGNDTLISGQGYSTLYGGNGDDVIRVNNIGAVVSGGAGNDFVEMYGFMDVTSRIQGGDGSDTLHFTAAADTYSDMLNRVNGFERINIEAVSGVTVAVTAPTPEESLWPMVDVGKVLVVDASSLGTTSHLVWHGENERGGAFSILGGHGDDTITGGQADDTISGGDGHDVLDGGSCVAGDWLDYSYSSAGLALTLDGSSQATANLGGNDTDTVKNFQNVIGSGGADLITGDLWDNTIEGGAGNDTLDGALGTNTVSYAQAAAGVVVHLDSGLTLTAPVGSHDVGDPYGTATGGAGNDYLFGFTNIVGSSHADTLVGNAGDNTIEGGAGNDVLDGATGVNTVSYAQATAGVVVRLDSGLTLTAPVGSHGVGERYGTATGGAGSDYLFNFSDILGSSHADTLVGDAGDNVINGGGGGDTLIGGDGNDTLRGGAWDPLVVADSHDSISGGAGNDEIHVLNYGAVVAAGAGDDFVDMHDFLDNHQVAPDTHCSVLGGDGTDTLHFSAPSDTASDILNHVSGFEFINIEAVTGVTVHVETPDPSGLATPLVDVGKVLVVDASSMDATSHLVWNGIAESNGAFSILGGAGDDTITGGLGSDTISGGDGHDVLDGGGYFAGDWLDYSYSSTGVILTLNGAGTATASLGGDDTDTVKNFQNVIGSGGADLITGDLGDNTIEGGAGNDVLDGSAGVNTVSYAQATAGVVVRLDSGLTLTTPVGSHDVDDPYGTASGGAGSDYLFNFANIAGSSHADTLAGNAGNNVITGGSGADTLSGGGGADIFHFTSPSDGNAGKTITDFTSHTGAPAEQDVLSFNHTAFGFAGTGTLDSAHFATSAGVPTGTQGMGSGTEAGFVYDTTNHNLYHDSNGSGAGGLTLITHLDNVADLNHTDIHLT